MSNPFLRVAAPLAAAVLAGHAAAGRVLRVGPTQPFPEIHLAVLVARPGDLVLVDPGSYAAFAIAGQGIAVAAASGTFTVRQSATDAAVTITGVPAGQRAAVFGAEVDYAQPSHAAFLVSGNVGFVHLHGCHVRTSGTAVGSSARALIDIVSSRAFVDQCSAVASVAGTTRTPFGSPMGPDDGLHAMLVDDSMVVVRNPQLRGCDHPGTAGTSDWGGDGLRFTGGSKVWIYSDFYGQPRRVIEGGDSPDYGGSAVHRVLTPGQVSGCGPTDYVWGAGSTRRGGFYSIDWDGGHFRQGNITFDRLVPLCIDVAVGTTITTTPQARLGGTLDFELWNLYARGYASLLSIGATLVPTPIVPGAVGPLLLDLTQPTLVVAAGTLSPRAIQRHSLPIPAALPLAGLQLTLQSALLPPGGGQPALLLTQPAMAVVVP